MTSRARPSGNCTLTPTGQGECWSSTQASIALSSGEAEYYGVVKGVGIGLGQQALGRDAGFHLPIRVWTDSSAAMGTASRQGLGKLRHLECHSLWVQQRLRRGEFELRKVLGTENPADLFTKHLPSREKVHQLLRLFGCEYRDGRPAAAPLLRPRDDDGRQGGHPADDGIDQLPTFMNMYEAKIHDESRLPHMHSSREMSELFPTIKAAPEPDNANDHDPYLDRLRRRQLRTYDLRHYRSSETIIK